MNNRQLEIEIKNNGYDSAKIKNRIAEGRKMIKILNSSWWSEENKIQNV